MPIEASKKKGAPGREWVSAQSNSGNTGGVSGVRVLSVRTPSISLIEDTVARDIAAGSSWMNDVIAAKFNPPVWMGDQIRRDKLLNRLDLALSQRLTLIHAPAGYGKTSILAQWRMSLEDRPHKVTWVTLDRDDSDLKRFVRQLIFAIRGDEPDSEETALAVDLPPRAALSAILKLLSGETRPFILILDDCHNADSESVLDFLQTLVKNAPANCHFVFASRDFPWLGQSVLAAEEQYLEISSEDLRFTKREANLLLSRVRKRIEPVEVSKILDRTEGWPIAVQLISLSLKGGTGNNQSIEQFGKSGTDVAVKFFPFR